MYNLDEVVKTYYNSVNTHSILNGDIQYGQFPERDFLMLSKNHFHQYSDTENDQLYQYIKDSIEKEGHPFSGMQNRSGLNVFAALEELSEQLLTMENNHPLCIYRKLLRFRKVTQYVEEDLLVCAFLAMRYKRYRMDCKDFAWNTTIRHNNDQLYAVMKKKISENHFHLYGSAPIFHLIWIELMNHVMPGDSLVKLSEKLERNQRVTRQHYSIHYREDRFISRILKAALIRVCLVRYCIGCELEMQRLSWINEVLLGEVGAEAYGYEIQGLIDITKSYGLVDNNREELDYALYDVQHVASMKAEHFWVGGERWLMYEMLKRELTDGSIPELYCQWFYAYLVIKQSIRCELVQVNEEMVGFENFSIYSGRKKGVYSNVDKMIESAVYGSMESGNIRSLEIRVTPKDSAEANAELIASVDAVIQRRREGKIPRAAYYFVFHFTKCPDEELPEKGCFSGCYCRHYEKRCSLDKQANAIYHFRENCRGLASNVLGIDACSMEIGCRPEVFAVAFRFLSEHVVPDIWGIEPVGQLKMTYHVGEDFLDVVDGLRAVDEAVRFLNLQCGDRIGHGTVLGIDVKSWYMFKNNTILISQQDYLDNVVWLYHKLVEYKIEGMEQLCNKLLEQFDTYYSLIYGSESHSRGNIYAYYEAWKLRGDAPYLYMSGKYQKNEGYGEEWLVNRKYPKDFSARDREDVCCLYYRYHYDWKVREQGSHSIEVYLLPIYVEGVAAVQKAMQKEIAAWGIGIEANPSSNLAISTIQGYDEHPIVQMYNKDLTWDVEKLSACPQINVSINTDDKGIFHTSLENEYALMACALEQVKDNKGNNVYNRQMIYQWLDNIREMGNIQSFKR